ncbi:MAG: DUF1579 domain-containing protein [Burkholderiaceae bacterium]
MRIQRAACVACMAIVVGAVSAQQFPDAAALLAAQKEAMTKLQTMNGVWRGNAMVMLPSGDKRVFTQTERIGPFLDGSVKVVEGRGYDPEGRVTFNAFGIVSYNPAAGAYTMRSYAQGRAGDFTFKPTADGYTWEIPAGPATIRYTASIKDDVLHEVGDRVVAGQDPIRIFEMTLKRVADTDWPLGTPVPPK